LKPLLNSRSVLKSHFQVAGEPMLDPRRWAVAPSDPGRETLAAEHTEEPEPNNKLAVFLRELQRGMKQVRRSTSVEGRE
jgi:hypothetical protein